MNIIYFTTAQDNNDYKTFTSQWSKKPNPSNQNFHNRLIRALSINNKINVISLRPFSKIFMNKTELKKSENVTTNIHWHYLTIKHNIIKKFLTADKEAKSIVSSLPKKSLILTDTINPLVISIANRCAKKFNLPIVGICTDSPSNISGTKKSYTTYLLKAGKGMKGYIGLTQDLIELFNEQKKPSLVFEGIVDDVSPKSDIKIDSNYFFFGGCLMEKYGIYNLIDAYKLLDTKKVKLVICGHHANTDELKDKIKDSPSIIYLETLNVNDVLYLEQHANACINPRPHNEDLERYSIPSKTIEYLSSGSLTISVKNKKLYDKFEDSCIWIQNNSVKDIYNALKKVMDMTATEREKIAAKAKEKSFKDFSFEAINSKINNFLERII